MTSPMTSSACTRLPADSWKAFSGSNQRGHLAATLSLEDFQRCARRRLPRAIYEYVAGAAETGASLEGNRSAFAEWGFLPQVLRNVSRRSQRVTLFGREYASPFGIAPMGLAALSAYRGDLVLARAAANAGIPFVLSGTSLTPLESVARAAPGTWFQAYLPGDIDRIDALLQRVRSAGIDTLMVTVDIPVAGNRENNIRAGFSTPLRPSLRLAWDGLSHPRWLACTLARTLLSGMPHFENSFAERGAPVISRSIDRDFSQRDHFDWSHIVHIRNRWVGKLVIKGILSPRDAALAARAGVDGIVVSNHGGRQLDGAVSPLRVLPDVLAAAPGTTVMLDGGVRRGSDVVKALALGAKMVFVGRPFNFAAAVAGEAGVAHAIGLLHAEIDRNLAMLGVRNAKDLSPQHLFHLRHPHSVKPYQGEPS